MEKQELLLKFQAISKKIDYLVDYNDINVYHLNELIELYYKTSCDYALISKKVLEVNQSNNSLKNLVISLNDKNQLTKYKREIFVRIKNFLNHNIIVFTNDLNIQV